MKAEAIEQQRRALPTSDERVPAIKAVHISLRSRFITWIIRHTLRPLMRWVVHGSYDRIASVQLFMARQTCRQSYGLELDYCVVGKVPGHVVSSLADTRGKAVLYIHGGGFIIPAVPDTHVRMLARWCRDLDAVGFMVDYRLAPFNKFPAPLDDCENAYRALLDLGFAPSRIAVAGESAGGALLLGLLQRIRKHGLPMPACAVPISPVTEMGRIHAPPSRAIKMKSDPMLPIASLQRIDAMYAGGWDASDPELSPLYADLSGFPPMYFLASDSEVLLDDTVLLARRAREAGIESRLDVWPVLPHAFPLLEQIYPEVRQAREDIVGFIRGHLADRHSGESRDPVLRVARGSATGPRLSPG
jgi:monoterpene epsilon-lactone hydrolase